MKKTSPVAGLLITIIIAITSCSKEESISSKLPLELKQAEAIMYEHPDSALQILQGMRVSASSKTLQHATWALLITQAKYRMYMEQSDSLINIAYDYFMKQDDVQRKALVLYLKGGMCNENESEEAQKQLLEAAKHAEKAGDDRLSYLIYSHLSNIYVFRSLNEYTLTISNKAYQYALKLKSPQYIANTLIYLGRIYTLQKKYEHAIDCYKKAIETAGSVYDRDKIARASNELAGIYLTIKDYEHALYYAKQALNTDEKKRIQGQLFLMFGKIYTEIGKADSAYCYLNKLLSFETYIRTVTDAYLTLYELSKKEQKYKEVAFYSDKLITGLDSIHRLDRSKVLVEMQEKYNQQKVIIEKNLLKIEKEKSTRNALILFALLLSIIAILIYIYQRKLMKKERTIQKKEEEIRCNTIKISENGLLFKRNLLRMEELMIQIEANEGIQEQLEELSETYSKIQQQNKILNEENQILQKNIVQYSSSLNTQSEEIKKLNALTEESQRLHDREKTLCNQLVKNSKILNDLITTPKYIDIIQWKRIEETINMIFDNFILRLSKKLPALTEYDLHLCCLIKLGINNANIATILGISSTSVSKQKYRLKERITQQANIFWENSTLDLWIWDF